MRSLMFISNACLVLCWCLTFSSIEAARASRPCGSPAGFGSHRPDARSWVSKARDKVLKSLWQIPPSEASTLTGGRIYAKPDAPPSVLARYGGDVVLRFSITSKEEAKALSEAVQVLFLDVWEFTTEWVDIRLSKDTLPALLNLLPTSLQHAHTPLMHDLAQSIFESYPAPALSQPLHQPWESPRPFGPELHRTPEENNIFFRDYQPLSVILPWMRLLRSLFPTHVRMISVGTSYEGRDIPALRVGVHPTNSEKPSELRKTIIVAGGQHAREWISTSTVNYVAYSFITAYGKDRDVTRLLEKFDFVFIPTLNPDGYAYTWDTDRLWRKNRQQTALRFCKGLDLDHAFGFQWDSAASVNDNPCSESFPGEGPFEAVEARRFADWIRNETLHNNVKIEGFIDLHSYSQQILYPYSYSCTTTPPNLETLEELALGLAKSIRLTKGERYDIAAACESTIPVKGSSTSKQRNLEKAKAAWPQIENKGGSALDWFYHEMNVSYTYQLKLRDTGNYGFLLPKEHIVPTGKEIFKAIEYFGRFLDGNKGIEDEDGSQSVSSAAVLKHPEEDWVMVDYENEKSRSGNGGKRLRFDDAEPATELRRRRR